MKFLKNILLLTLALVLMVAPGAVLAADDCAKITSQNLVKACTEARTSDDFAQGFAPGFCSSTAAKGLSAAVSRFCATPKCEDFNKLTDSTIAAIKDAVRDPAINEIDKYKAYCAEQASLTTTVKTANADKVNNTLKASGYCTGLTPDATQDIAEDACKLDANAGAQLEDLKAKIAGGQIVAINEEPIGTQNVYNRMQICTTNFVRNTAGHLQEFGPKTDTGEARYAIEIDSCKSFIVENCTPNNTNINTGIRLNEASSLPLAIYCDRVQIFTGTSGVGLLKNYIRFIYLWAAGFIGVVSVFVIMLSGIQLSAAGSDSEAVSKAKQRIVQSLSALIILFLSGLILYVINPTFFVNEDIAATQRAEENRLNDPLPPAPNNQN